MFMSVISLYSLKSAKNDSMLIFSFDNIYNAYEIEWFLNFNTFVVQMFVAVVR